MTPFEEVKELARRIFEAAPIEQHPFVRALSGGAIEPRRAQEIAVQIFHVVDHVPRLLAALLSNLPDWQRRTPIVENLWEEHGRGREALVHVETYRRFLASIGVAGDYDPPGLAAIAYNRAVLDLCLHHHFAEGLGALGVIEEIVARVSPLVARYATARAGVGRGEIVHFSDHEVLDVKHADELYQLAATELPRNRARVEQGMRLGHYYHCRLYSDLLALG